MKKGHSTFFQNKKLGEKIKLLKANALKNLYWFAKVVRSCMGFGVRDRIQILTPRFPGFMTLGGKLLSFSEYSLLHL